MKNKKYLFEYIKKSWQIDRKSTFALILMRVIVAINISVEALLLSKLINDIVASVNNNNVTFIYSLVFIIGVWIINMLCNIFYKMTEEKLRIKLSQTLTLILTRKKANIKYSILENADNQDLMERIGTDPSDKFISAIKNSILFLEYIIQFISLLLIIATKQWFIAIIVGLLIIPFYIMVLKNGEEEYDAYEESAKHFRRSKYFRLILSDREHANERTLFGYGKYINKKWHDEFSNAIKIEDKANRKVYTSLGISACISILLLGFIAVAMLFPLKNSYLSIGFYIAILKAIINYIESITSSFSQIIQELEKSVFYYSDFKMLMDLEENSNTEKKDININKIEKIEFNNVSFKYPNTDRYILNDLSFTLYGNKQYAFVGHNGAGKSTIIKLLTGFYCDYDGTIKINGTDIKEINRNSLNNIFSVVYQDYSKYQISLGDNLFCGAENKTSLSNEEKEILNDLNFDKTFGNFETSLDIPLGKLDEEGIDLSGGQWQSIAIARSLMSNASVHILDEPTSAIDPIKEANLYKMFAKRMNNKFAIYITHRLGAAKMTDEILVLSNGKVIEKGNHDELMKHNSVYCEMYETQRSWYNEI